MAELVTEGAIFDTCDELGIGFVAYSPLGRGFLTGQIQSIDDIAPKGVAAGDRYDAGGMSIVNG